MAEIFQMLLERRISPQSVISWLDGNPPKDEVLEPLTYLRGEFVPVFLNFLRDQSNGVLQVGPTNGLTPCKGANLMHVVKYVSPGKDPDCRAQSRKHQTSSRAKTLKFFETPVKNKDSRNQEITKSPNLDRLLHETDFSPTPTSKLSSNLRSSTPKWSRDETSGSHRYAEKRHSVQRLSLGDFISSEPRWGNKKKSPVPRDNRTISSGPQLPQALDISDENAFPMVGCTPTQGKQSKRRINPTRITSSGSMNAPNFSPFNQNRKALFGTPQNQSSSSTFMMSEEGTKTLNEERELLRQERLKRQESSSRESAKCCGRESPTNNVQQRGSDKHDYREVSPDFVTNQMCLDILAHIYSELILFNMVPSIMVELYYVIQLLTVRVAEIKDKSNKEELEESYLGNSHNCVYFATNVLLKVIELVKLLDRTTVRLLSENPRIIMFSEDLQKHLLWFLSSPSPFPILNQQPKSPTLGGVSFQSDTDNRNNFPGDQAFHVFRKQRDTFYEIIRAWEENHLTPGWSYSQALGARIRYLFSLRADSTNFVHFARLFQSQLLKMCHGEDNRLSETQQNTEDFGFLTLLKKQHPEKYKRLHERLVTPSKLGGPCPPPSFPGSQEFFKDFIVTAAHGTLNRHLKDIFIAHIQLLNVQEYTVSEQDGDPLNNLVYIEARRVLLNLCLLAKFLGFLEFLPYYTTVHMPENVLAAHIELRSKVCPPINLNVALRQCATSGHIVIGVTWIVEFLSMVDPVALHSKPYLTVVMTLIAIHKLIYVTKPSNGTCAHGSPVSKAKRLSPANSLLLKLQLGWLFDLPNFPNGLFFADVTDADIDQFEYKENIHIINSNYKCLICQKKGSSSTQEEKELQLEILTLKTPSKKQIMKGRTVLQTPRKRGNPEPCLSPLKNPESFLSPVKVSSECNMAVSMIDTPETTPLKQTLDSQDGADHNIYLDMSDFADQQLITICCPFICELKNLLSDFLLGMSSNKSSGTNSCRRITPLSASDKDSLVCSQNHLQLQLEDNFFHNQPSSVRKTIEFVMERLSSNIIKRMRMTVIPENRENALERLKDIILTFATSSSSDSVKETIKKHSDEIGQEICSNIKTVCAELSRQNSKESVNSVLLLLLPPDITSQEVEICQKIIARSCEEKLNTWVQSHFTPALFSKDLTSDSERILRQTVKTVDNLSVNLQTSCEDASHSNFDISDGSAVVGESSLMNSLNASVTEAIDSPINRSSLYGGTKKTHSSEAIPIMAVKHDPDIIFPSKLVIAMKYMVYRLTNSPDTCVQDMEPHAIQNLLQKVVEVLTKRKDVTQAVFRALEALSVDLAIVIIARAPSLMTVENKKAFISLWKPVTDGGVIPLPCGLSSFFGPRIVMLVAQNLTSTHQRSAWKKINEFTLSLLSANLITPSSLQEQCISLLRHSWPEEILAGLSRCIKEIAEDVEKQMNQYSNPPMTEFLEWVGWILGDMEELPEFL